MDKKPTVKLVLNRKYKHESEGYIALRISIPGTRRYKYKNLGYKVPVASWDDENKMLLKTYPNSSYINDDIHNEKIKLEIELLNDKMQGAQFTGAFIGKKLKGKTDSDFIAFFSDYLAFMKTERKGREGARKKHSPNYIAKYEGYYNRIVEFAGERLSFSSINVKWLESLEVHFSKTMSYETSLPIFMSKIISVLRRASEQGLFDMKTIKGYQQPVYIDPDRPYLTLDETDLWAKELVYSGKLKDDDLMAACFFLVECWAGLRFSDWGRFKIEKIHNNTAIRVRAKKNGEPVYVFLHKSPRLKKLVEFIQKNKITFTLKERMTNAILGKLAFKIELDKKVTTHVGRHTCATLLLEMGYSKGKIAEWLGISERTVDIYAKQIRLDLKKEYEQLGGI